MTEQQNNDLVFRTNGEEKFRIDGNGPWKNTELPSTQLELKNEVAPNTITFNTSETQEIAKFTEEGFYYKGEFIDDAGEVHRLMKEVLSGMLPEQAKDETVLKAVPYVELISDDQLDTIYATLNDGPWGENKQVGEKARMYGFARTVLASIK